MLTIKGEALGEAYWRELWRVGNFGTAKSRLCLSALRRLFFIHGAIQYMSEGFVQEYAYQENAECIVLARRT